MSQPQIATVILDQVPNGTAGRIRLSATRLRPGNTLTISGYLIREDTGEGVPYQPIHISTSPSLFSTSTRTVERGFFSTNVNIPSTAAPGDYEITAEFLGAILPE